MKAKTCITENILQRQIHLAPDVPNPVSHVAYGYATQMCVLDKSTGRAGTYCCGP